MKAREKKRKETKKKKEKSRMRDREVAREKKSTAVAYHTSRQKARPRALKEKMNIETSKTIFFFIDRERSVVQEVEILPTEQ